MPGYEPFLLCDFHVHTRWSDGRLTVREVVDLYGETGRFDVIAITDHILMKRDFLARAGRLASLGYRRFSVTESCFDDYLDEIAHRGRTCEAAIRPPGAPRGGNHAEPYQEQEELAHRGVEPAASTSAPISRPRTILKEIRRQDALSIACHPHHRTTRRIEISTCYLWDHRKRLVDLVDVWEAANRDDLFSVTSLKHYPYVANSDFHKPKHLYSWKTLLRCEKNWEAIARTLRSNVDVALTLYRNGAWAA